MPGIAIREFGGEIPRVSDRGLPDNLAADALNTDLASGEPSGFTIPEVVVDLTSYPSVRKAYRLPGTSGSGLPDAWLPLPSEFSSVVRSPLVNDNLRRIYWTNPGQGAFWSTYARIAAGGLGGNAPYNLGTIQPASTPLTVDPQGGSGTIVDRSYCYTYYNIYNEESAPNEPSGIVSGPADAVWYVSGLPTSAPAQPPGKNFPPTLGAHIYRTTATPNGAQFYRIGTYGFNIGGPPPMPFADTLPDSAAVLQPELVTTSWANPPANLDGLVAMPGGMLAGFTTNTVHFCEPNRPHTWPPGYDQSVAFDVVGLAVWNGQLTILTRGPPSVATGSSPAAITITQIQTGDACVSRGSVVVTLIGVVYAARNGIILLTIGAAENITAEMIDPSKWFQQFNAGAIVAARHTQKYLAINGTGVGFMIDPADKRMGVVRLNTFSNATSVWTDLENGRTYICADRMVYIWGSSGTGPLNYRWRSKEFFLQDPLNLAAAQVSMGDGITDPPPIDVDIPLDNFDPTLELPDGVNALFRLYAGETKVLKHQEILTKPIQRFRLPSGYKSHILQIEIVSRVPLRSIELATTMAELSNL